MTEAKVQVDVELEWVPAAEGLFEGYWSGRFEQFQSVDEDGDEADFEELDQPISESDEDFTKLVANVVESIRQQFAGREVVIDWSFYGPPTRREAKSRGIELPERTTLSA
ncbi:MULTISPECIES: hypothetical protein [unclassified Nocardia]|uniref:hypothetical protein n=1 Tax=unclassified Nocardia TaxID=2637762 RepID=UPI001CE48726|nr:MULTISPECIES: hypothetical protein [unclassified Nocardia]